MEVNGHHTMALDISMGMQDEPPLNHFPPQHLIPDDLVDHSTPGSPIEEDALPWMTHHQPVVPNDLPRAPGPLVFEGFIPQPFPSDFVFVNNTTEPRQPLPTYEFPSLTLHPLNETATSQGPPTVAPVETSGAEPEHGEVPNDAEESPAVEKDAPPESSEPKIKRPPGRPRGTRDSRQRRPKGSGKRGGWSKGMKLGPRPIITPSEQFNKLHQQAMDAFIDQHDPTKALGLIIQAIEINPEVFSAHTLLCEIYLALGEQPKAVSVLWMGAHSFPRDPFVWQQFIDTCLQRTTYDRVVAWQQASYGLRQLTKIDPKNLDYRFQYANSLAKTGKSQPAITQLTKYILPRMPHNSSSLKLCAECAQDSNLRRIPWALQNYEEAIAYYKENGMKEEDTFEWMDVNVYTDLISKKKGDPVEQIQEAIKICKKLSRWLLGREQETYWDEIVDDDREWDAEDDPRRSLLDEYRPGRFEQEAYGIGLPLEIRAQLGILRLRLGGCREEALAHFEWLEPEENEEGASVHDFPDIFLSVATALGEAREHQEALRFFDPLLQNKTFNDHAFYVGVGTSSYICGKKNQAMECFEAALACDPGSVEVKTRLSQLYAERGEKEKAFEYADDAVRIARAALPKTGNRKYEKRDNRLIRQAAEAALKQANRMAGPRPQRARKRKRKGRARDGEDLGDAEDLTPTKKRKAHQRTLNVNDAEHIRQLYDTLEYNTEAMRADTEPAKSIWMECARDLVNVFTDFTLFFPADTSERFTGYEAIKRKLHPKAYSLMPSIETPSTAFSPSPYNPDSPLTSIEPLSILDPSPSTIPSDYHSISFSSWLDIFLEYALVLSTHTSLPPATRKESSYKIIRDTLRCSIFRHSHPFLLRIHTAWLAIALGLRDEHTLFNTILRWFIKEYVFCTDAYRLFGAINLFFLHSNPTSTIFANSSTQKFMWRHILTLDHRLPLSYRSPNDGDQPVPDFMRRERADLLGPITVSPQEMDVVLLTVYGQMAALSGSFNGALQHFFRARALDPRNALVLLSISLCYFHEACRRQGKQGGGVGSGMEVVQGWAVFQEYEDARVRWAERREREGAEESEGLVELVKREVEFNRARVWLMLGMGDLAVRTMERLVDDDEGIGEGNEMEVDGDGEERQEKKVDWRREAAYAMANTYASNGDAETAKSITERYLVVE